MVKIYIKIDNYINKFLTKKEKKTEQMFAKKKKKKATKILIRKLIHLYSQNI